MYAKIVLLGALLLALSAPQVPEPQEGDKRPRPPADAAPLPPVREPFRSAVERKDLLQRFTEPSPLEGFYELRSFTRPGALEVEARGFLIVGRRYLSVQLVGRTPGAPALQSAFRAYRIAGTRLVMTTMLGFHADPDETWSLEPVGEPEECGFRLLGTRLQLHVEGGAVLEFERIE